MNNNQIIILPNYVQKFIIKILCKFINQNNKLVDLIGNSMDDYRNNELEIKKLIMKLALVSKDWFKTMQTNLTVCVDFNYLLKKKQDDDDEDSNECSDKNKSIILMENIKTLKLHYDNKKPWFYKKFGGPDGEEFEITLDYINKQLKLLSENSLKKLILRNINLEEYKIGIDELETLYQCDATKKDIQILEFSLGLDTTLESIEESIEKISKVISIIIYDCYDKSIILKAFESWYKSITSIYISHYQNDIEYTGFSLYDLLSSSSNGGGGLYLSNIQFIEIYNTQITLKEILTLFKSAKNLTHISIDICFNSLIYFLSNKDEQLNLDRCICSSVVKRLNNNDDNLVDDQEYEQQQLEIEQKEFNENWLLFEKLLNGTINDNNNNNNNEGIPSPSILNLNLNHHCTYEGAEISWPIETTPFPNGFIEKFSNLIIASPNLTKFSMSATTPQIFKEIIKNNKSITHFESNIVGTNKENVDNFLLEIDALINQNPQIQEFNITKYEFDEENLIYKEDIILKFNNSNNNNDKIKEFN